MIVYSLVCWGGRTGKAVTLTIASPCVVTRTNHGLRDGARLVFSTTGALPTGITAGTTYYAKSTAANTFNLYTDAALTSIVNTSGSQSGTHTAKSVLMVEYFAQYPGRWGDSGSERCYDGIVSWNTARSGASGLDVEHCEIGEAFVETLAAALSINVPSGKNSVASRVDGGRSSAFHAGVFDGGYRLAVPSSNITALALTRIGDEIDGIEVSLDSTSYGTRTCVSLVSSSRCINSILRSAINTAGTGVMLLGPKAEISNSIICNFAVGINHDSYQEYGVMDNDIIVKCGTIGCSFGTSGSSTGRKQYVRNTISLGNTVNWKTGATALTSATNNLGLTGEAWISSGGTRLETSETAPFASIFADYDNNDFRPASASSPQVDSGVEYYGALNYDIADAERPNYNNGGAESFDIGCYEFDHGYGIHPASTTLMITASASLVGAEIRIYDLDNTPAGSLGTELSGVETASGATYSYTGTTGNTVWVQIMLEGYREFGQSLTLPATDSTFQAILSPDSDQ